MKTTFIIHRGEDGQLGASAKGFPIYTAAASFDELKKNIHEAASLYSQEVAPIELEYELNFSEFFKSYRMINAKYIAQRTQISESLLSHFIHGRRTPKDHHLKRIVNCLHEIGAELQAVNLRLD